MNISVNACVTPAATGRAVEIAPGAQPGGGFGETGTGGREQAQTFWGKLLPCQV